jgi:membrane fusion protein (multidrug efflux system)
MPRISELEHEPRREEGAAERSARGRSAEPPDEPVRPKRRLLPLALGTLVLSLLVGGYFWLHGRNRESTDDAQVDGHIAPISAKVSGSVLEVLVENNMSVKAGQVLVRLDPRDYQARVDQLKAAVAVARAQATAAQAGVPLTRSTTSSGTSGAAAQVAAAQAEAERAQVAAQQAQSSGIAVARANLAQAEANNRKAQADVERMRQLAAKQEISQQQFDAYVAAAQVTAAQLHAAQEQLNAAQQTAANAEAAVQSAQARVQQARAGLEESRAGEQQVNVTAAQARSAEAGIQQATANLGAAELALSYTTIVAPVDGVVTQKSVEPGQIVQPGQALMAIIPLHDVWVTANFKETQLKDVRPGQRAEVHVDMYGTTIEGRVDSIAGATGAKMSLLPPENATGNFVKVVQRIPVKIVFDRLPQGVVLRPGMNVDATILTK